MDKKLFEQEELRIINEQREAAKEFDKFLATFCTGGIVISLFLAEFFFSQSTVAAEYLIAGLVLYVLSLICLVLNLNLSYENHGDALDFLRSSFCAPKNQQRSKKLLKIIAKTNKGILWLNRFASFFFITASINMIFFVIKNALELYY